MDATDSGLEPRRRLTQAEARELTRGQLLAAAATVFARKGFGGASLEEIAELAGYTTGAVYYHFANKEQLFLELLRSGSLREIRTRVGSVHEVFGDSASEDVWDRLAGFLESRADREGRLAPLQGEFWLYALRHPAAMQIVAEKLREEESGFEPSLATAMERLGTPSGITPKEMSEVALVLFEGLARRRWIGAEDVPADLFPRVLKRLMGAEGRAAPAQDPSKVEP